MHAIPRHPHRTPPRRASFIRLLAAASLASSVAAVLSACATGPTAGLVQTAVPTSAPTFKVDTAWPQPLPNNWILGQVSGVATDADDHIWVLQRPLSLTEDERGATLNPPHSKCCAPAPSVLEFDRAGKLLRSWGGAGEGYDWPGNEHGIHVDHKGFVWITGNGEKDGQVLKFTRDGKFVLQIGTVGAQTNSADTTRLGQPASLEVDPATNEVYIADGYYNKRVIVFDAETGAYKRHWGAYGKPPVDVKPDLRRSAPPTKTQLESFGNPVHCMRVARDGMVYVCDRLNNRVQVFRTNGSFVNEFSVEPVTAGNGSVWDIAMSRDAGQQYLFMADGRNNEIHVIERDTGKVLSRIGRSGRYAGEFHWVHDLAIDSSGNLYAGEVDNGKRVQRFIRQP